MGQENKNEKNKNPREREDLTIEEITEIISEAFDIDVEEVKAAGAENFKNFREAAENLFEKVGAKAGKHQAAFSRNFLNTTGKTAAVFNMVALGKTMRDIAGNVWTYDSEKTSFMKNGEKGNINKAKDKGWTTNGSEHKWIVKVGSGDETVTTNTAMTIGEALKKYDGNVVDIAPVNPLESVFSAIDKLFR